MNRISMIFGFILFGIVFSSCDKSYTDIVTIENKMDYAVKLTGTFENIWSDSISEVILQTGEKKEYVYSEGIGELPLFFDNGFDYLEQLHFYNTTIYFNDTVFVTYNNDCNFDKNLCLKKCWDVTETPIRTYRGIYTIDEQDYQNALEQCGYAK